MYDKDNKGVIDNANIQKALGLIGKKMTKQIASIIDQVDENGDGQIDVGEFKNMMINAHAKISDKNHEASH
jgi:Ca2+-binding EF-hand superfamily protein